MVTSSLRFKIPPLCGHKYLLSNFCSSLYALLLFLFLLRRHKAALDGGTLRGEGLLKISNNTHPVTCFQSIKHFHKPYGLRSVAGNAIAAAEHIADAIRAQRAGLTAVIATEDTRRVVFPI